MALKPGTMLGHYEILSLIGVGGMGEVYHARDTKLRREVALKLLPEAYARDPDRLARFRREAHLLASLNHPNIAAIYGVEDDGDLHYLVLEYVPGETLRDQLLREGPVPIEEALPIARQIAEALEAAHEKPIIHRDLKPANVKVTPEGQVKVLDFGLAKAYAAEESEDDIHNAPTLSVSPTIPGAILGTPAYMSPEQARGKQVDKRTDLWAFGCVLYELLTAKQAFAGENVTDILGAVLHKEPDWSAMPAATPTQVRALLRRCLQKDKTLRQRDAGDARLDLSDALSSPTTEGPAPAPQITPWRRSLRWALVAFVLGLVVAGTSVWMWMPPPPGQAPARLVVALPAAEQLTGGVAFSPDGTHLAYVASRAGGRPQLYLRALDSLETKPIPGTEGANEPFFSPDGQWMGFAAGGKLKKIPIDGGPSLNICDAPGVFGASWGDDDTIIFAPTLASGLWRVSASGGTPQEVTKLDRSKGEISHLYPQFLPGGKAVLFTVTTGTGWDGKQTVAQVLAAASFPFGRRMESA